MKKILGRSVYSNALAIFLLAAIFLLGITIVLTQGIILKEFAATERSEMVARLQRLGLMLLREVKPLDQSASLLAKNPDVRRLIDQPTRDAEMAFFANLRLDTPVDLIALCGPDQRLRISHLREASIEAKIGSPEALIDQVFSKDGPPLDPTAEVKSGFVLMNGQLVAIAFSPIIDADSGELRGIVVCGRILNEDAVGYLEGIFSAQIKFIPFLNLRVSAPGNEHILRMLTTNEVAVVSDRENSLTGYMFLRSPNGQPLGLVSFTQPQNLLIQGERASRLFLLGIALAGGALVLVVWYLLDRTILRRIRSLTQKLDREKKLGRLPVKLNFEGEDELGELAQSIEDLAQLLENTQSQYRNVVEDQTEMICRFDADFRLTFANEVFIKFFKLEQTELATQRLDLLLDPQNRKAFRSHYRLLIPERSLGTFIHEVPGSEMAKLWLRTTLRKSFAADQTPTGGQWVSSDISPQIEAQLQTLESERRFRRLFEAASDGILLVEGEQFRVSDINPSLGQMLDLKPEELLGIELKQIVPFRACQMMLRRIDLNQTGTFDPGKIQTRILKDDGTKLFIELSLTSYEWEGQRFFQFNFHDVTHRVKGEEELRRLSSRLLKSQDDERRKIARDLHDSTAQNLSALEMNLTLLQKTFPQLDPKAQKLLDETRQLTTDCSREIRNISYLLHPPLIEEVGLNFAIKWFATGFSQRTGIGVSVEIADNVPRLASEIEMPLYRIIQEALTNIYRHSGADTAELKLTHDAEDIICLSITDNGHGFDHEGRVDSDDEPVQEGVGLAGMRGRTVELGGQFNIESSPDGVSIVIIIPIPREKS